MDNIQAIIIEEDQKEAQSISEVIQQHCPYVSINGVGNDLTNAKKLIKESPYDLVIIGFRTGMDYGFQLLKNSSFLIDEKELIIINTKNEDTVHTFVNEAIDHIVKPVNSTSVVKAVEKVKKHFYLDNSLDGVPQDQLTRQKSLNMIAIPSIDEVRILKTKEVIYLKSEGKYTCFSLSTNNTSTIMSSRNLGEYDKLLVHSNFLRIHNSYLVNMDHVIHVQKKGGLYLKMSNMEYIPVSKRKKEILYKYLGI